MNGNEWRLANKKGLFIVAIPIPPCAHWKKIRVLEDTEAATAFATGMAAISNTLFTFLTAGKRVVSIKDTYGGTNKIFLDFLPQYGVHVSLCETGNRGKAEMEIAKGCGLVYLETPTNPTLKVIDIQRLSAQPPKKQEPLP